MPVTLEQSEQVCLVRLQGEINIACAADLKKVLLQALGSGKQIRLDLEGATELDVTALQLLCAAEREARGSGLGCELAGGVPAEIGAFWLESGFAIFPIGAELQ